MKVFPIFDLVIGMIFIYFLLSVICSSAVELWLTVRRTRARLLQKWLKAIFNLQALDPYGIPMVDEKGKPICVGQAIVDHCMVIALSPKGKSNSYLGAENFTIALLDKISITRDDPKTFNFIEPPNYLEGFIEKIKKTTVISAELKRTFLFLAYEALQESPETALELMGDARNAGNSGKGKIVDFRKRLEDWYNLNSERLTGTMKRKTLPITIIMAIVLTIGLNVDSVSFVKYFYDNKNATITIGDAAIKNFTEKSPSTKNENFTDLKSAFGLELPIGDNNRNLNEHFFGWLATTLAIVFGAPFWFDILNKIVNLRNTGPKPKEAEVNKETNSLLSSLKALS